MLKLRRTSGFPPLRRINRFRQFHYGETVPELTRRGISLGTIRVFPGSIRPTTDSSYGDVGSR